MASSRRAPRWLLLLTVLLAVFALGPRTSVQVPKAEAAAASVVTDMPRRLDALPAWLARREQRAGVSDTAVAKRVRFHEAARPQRTVWSVVYLHGFSATRQETAPLAERVADSLGANLFETRLTGHGLPGDSLGEVTAADWLADAMEAMEIGRRLGDSVVVIGTSTGGTLAVWLGAQPTHVRAGLARLVLISPNFGPMDRRTRWLTWPWARIVLPRFIPFYEWTPANEEQRRFWTVRYPSRALFPMQALVAHVQTLAWQDFRTPTLLFVNDLDEVVDAKRTLAWMTRVALAGTASLERVPVYPIEGEDDHVLAGRIVSPSQTDGTVQRIVHFVRPSPTPITRRSLPARAP